MRKLFYLLILFTVPFQSLFAQTADTSQNSLSLRLGTAENILVPVNLSIIDREKPELSLPPGEGKMDNSFSVGLMILHPVTSRKAYRLKVDVSTINQQNESDATSIHRIIAKREVSQTIIHINPGAQWGFSRNNFTIYGGCELSWNIYGKLTLSENKKETNSKGDTTFFEGSTSSLVKSGFSIGPGTFFGFSYRPFKNFAFGTELSAAAVYNYLGGDTEVKDNFTESGTLKTVSYTKNISYKGFGVTRPRGFLTATFYF